jgi:hypothetical protein
LPAGLGARALGPELGCVRHSITHHRIRLGVRRARDPLEGLAAGPLCGEDGRALAWVPRAALPDLPLTGMARKVLRSAFASAPEAHGDSSAARYARARASRPAAPPRPQR